MIWGKKLSNKQHHHSLAIEKTNPVCRQLITLMYAYIYCNDHIKYQQFTSYFLLWYVKWARQYYRHHLKEACSGIKSEIQNISDEALSAPHHAAFQHSLWVKARECMRRSKKKKTLASGTSMTNTVTISPSPVLIRLMAQLNVLSLERK